jgi:lipoate-protein ligase B
VSTSATAATATTRGAYLYSLPGTTPYAAALAEQRDLAAARSQNAIPDVLLLLEHDEVVTLGTRTDAALEVPDRDVLTRAGIEVVEAARGGRATYHGPGQLVGYPILDLRPFGRDVRRYVELLEETLIGALADLGVPAEVREGQDVVGVWTTSGRKIASLGIHVANWITTHGFALNVANDLSRFSLFTPCGLVDAEFTSVSAELGRQVSRAEAEEAFVRRFGGVFGFHFEALPR